MQRDGGPGGAGGAGNPTGGSFTGPAEALEIVGDFAFAYSGQFEATTSAQTALDFRTGNYFFVGQYALYGAIDPTSPGGSRSSTSGLLSFNGVNLLILASGESSKRSAMEATCQILIPSYTEVKVVLETDDNQGSQFMSVSMVGRIYRG